MISPTKKTTTALLIAIAILAIAAYFSSFTNGFTHFDDQVQITENTDIIQLNWQKIKTIFSSTYVGMYQPVSTLFYGLLVGFFGMNPEVFHGFSFLLHLINGWILFSIFKQINVKESVAVLLTAIFVLHPMQVESVSWASATSNVIFTFFYLLAFWNFIQYGRNKSFSTGTFVLFILACLSKATAVSFPVVIFFYLLIWEKENWLKSIKIISPYLLISLAIGIITIISRESAEHLTDLSLSYTALERILIFCYTLIFYPIQFILPLNLSPFYSFPSKINDSFPIIYYIAPVFVLLFSALIYRFRKNQFVLFGAAFYLITIAPVLQLIPVGSQIVTDRYIYLSGIGLLLILIPILSAIKSQKAIQIGTLFIAMGLAFYSYNRTQVWESDATIWADVIEKDENVAQAWNNKGILAESIGNFADAERFYSRAIQLNPRYADPYSNRGNVYAKQGKSQAALNDFNQAIALKPNHADALFNRANEFIKVGDYNTALEDLNASLTIQPKADALTNRALIYIQTRKMELAINDLNQAIAMNPRKAQAYYLRGISKYQTIDSRAGCEDFQIAANLGDEASKQALEQYCR